MLLIFLFRNRSKGSKTLTLFLLLFRIWFMLYWHNHFSTTKPNIQNLIDNITNTQRLFCLFISFFLLIEQETHANSLKYSNNVGKSIWLLMSICLFKLLPQTHILHWKTTTIFFLHSLHAIRWFFEYTKLYNAAHDTRWHNSNISTEKSAIKLMAWHGQTI